MKHVFMALALCLLAWPAQAKIVTQDVDYRSGDVAMKSFLAYDDAQPGRRPGVLVIHEWWGHNEFARGQARRCL